MSETTEERYTLREAQRELAKRECANHGHSWDVNETLGGGPNIIVCSQCGWMGSVAMGKRP